MDTQLSDQLSLLSSLASLQLVMEEEQKNPDYAFLFDLKSPGHVYYRWVGCPSPPFVGWIPMR